MILFQTVLLCLCVGIPVLGTHPIHVSVTEIEMDEKDKRLEVMMRIFIDDLELTLRERLSQPELDLLSKPVKERDLLISKYLSDRFKLVLDGKVQKTNYLGHEQEDLAFIV